MKYKIIPPRGKITAYYDLKSSPITFDFIYFIAAAVAYAKSLGSNLIDVTLVADAWRVLTPREKKYTASDRIWRLWNLQAQIVQITPNVRNFSIMHSPPEFINPDSYPVNYNPRSNYLTPYSVKNVVRFHELGIDVRCFNASRKAREIASKISIESGKFVTLTPRTAGFDSARDSCLSDWFEAYKKLVSDGYEVVVIPDQDDVLGAKRYSSFPWRVLPEVSMSLDLKLAFYQMASANVISSGGNIGPVIFSSAPFVIVKSVNEASPVATEGFHAAQGFPVGSQYPWFSKNQSFAWSGDSPQEILAGVEFQI